MYIQCGCIGVLNNFNNIVCAKMSEESMKKCSVCGCEFDGAECPVCSAQSPDTAIIQAKKDVKRAKSAVAKKQLAFNKGLVAFVIIAVIAVIAAVVLLSIFISQNPFRQGFMPKIKLGDTEEQIVNLLGEPDKITENGTKYTYYSDNYLKLYEKAQNSESAKKELASLKYKKIDIEFTDGKVSHVYFDNNAGGNYPVQEKWRRFGGAGQKIVFEPETLDANIDTSQPVSLVVKITYIDGSYQYYTLSVTAAQMKQQNNDDGSFKDWEITWNDTWGKYDVLMQNGR